LPVSLALRQSILNEFPTYLNHCVDNFSFCRRKDTLGTIPAYVDFQLPAVFDYVLYRPRNICISPFTHIALLL
jgi:hypothetical protein